MSSLAIDSDDEIGGTRPPRASLDAQRFTIITKKSPMIPQTTTTTTTTAPVISPLPKTAASTFLLPILLPSTNPANSTNSVQPIVLTDPVNPNDGSSSTTMAALLPREFADVELSIASELVFFHSFFKALLTAKHS